MKKYETIKEAMARTRLSRTTLMKFDKDGVTYRIGRTVRFDSDALDRAIAEQRKANEVR